MIDPSHEQPQSGPGDFHDAVSVEFCDSDSDVFGFMRLAHAPAKGQTTLMAVMFADGSLVAETVRPALDVEIDSWERVEVDGALLATERPLETWAASFAADEAGFDLKLSATSAPIDLTDYPTTEIAKAAGVSQYEQLCDVGGTVRIGSKSRTVSCTGRRCHVWGAPDWNAVSMRRSLYAVSDGGRGVTIMAVRLSGSDGHGDDLLGGYLVEPDSEPIAFEEVRLSTVYDRAMLPGKAGLELYLAGDEFARRLSGEASHTRALQANGRLHRISFLRWSFDGRPAYGSYQTVSRT